ncbi:MAG: serine/threonine protein kinase [Myxococcales bacterium]|nr:serine/threonine protein kinase [Myxococcales bacterium]MCB9576508.1 serine/threonine protein kinase [Polyangiaceae bacterium]
MPAPEFPRRVGRYAIFDEIAAGGMATVHFGRLIGGEGFTRRVAIKRMFPQFAKDPDFLAMFLDEARLSARILHPNVVQTLDVVRAGDELLIVMEYVHGESLSRLLRRARASNAPKPSLGVSLRLVLDVLSGLEAAHSAKSEAGTPLGIVHRDVSPQNLLVGADGLGRLIDFGIAKARGRMRTTPSGQVKGKLAYMAPEQMSGAAITRQSDIYAVGVLTWELLTGRRLFSGETDAQTLALALGSKVPAPSTLADVPRELDELVARALMRDPRQRFALASEMAGRIESCAALASTSEVRRWVAAVAGEELSRRERRFVEIESAPLEAPETVPASAPALPEAKPRTVGHDDATVTTAVGEVRHEDAEPVRRRGRLVALAAVLAIIVIATGLTLSTTRRGTAPSASEGATGAPAAPPVALPEEKPAPSASTAAAASASAPASASAAPTKPRATPRNRPPAPTVKKRTNCNPPYYVDSDGIQHIKRECL